MGTPSLCWLPREKPPGSKMQVRKSCSCHLSLALLESLVTRLHCFAAKAVWVHLGIVACALRHGDCSGVLLHGASARITPCGRAISFKSSNGKSHHSRNKMLCGIPALLYCPFFKTTKRREMLWGRWGISASGGGWWHGPGLGAVCEEAWSQAHGLNEIGRRVSISSNS